MKEKSRNLALDLLRGAGIVLMVLGHYVHFDFFKAWLYAFHMPLFFVVSGVFFPTAETSVSFWGFVKKRAKSLLIPYATCGGLIALATLFLKGVDSARGVVLSLLWDNTSSEAGDAGTFWFLSALFFAEVLFFVLTHLIRNKPALLTVSFVISAASVFLGNLVALPWALSPALVALFFLAAGFVSAPCVRAPQPQLPHAFVRAVCLVVLGFLLTCFIGVGEVLLRGEPLSLASVFSAARAGMRLGTYPGGLLFFANALLGVFAAYRLCLALSHAAEKTAPIKALVRALSFCGKNSLYFLLFSSFFGNQISALRDLVFVERLRFPFSYLFLFFQLCLIFALTLSTAKLFSKFPVSLLVGRGKPNRKEA